MTGYDLAKIGQYLASMGYVEGREGNLSERVGNGALIKATNVFMAFATPEDFSYIDLEGNLIYGKPPSSEFRLHTTIYKNVKNVNFIVHTHPVYTLALSQRYSFIPIVITEGKLYFSKEVPVLPLIEPGTQELADKVTSYIQKGYEAVVLKDHGLVSVGETLDVAVMRTISVEKSAKIILLSRNLI